MFTLSPVNIPDLLNKKFLEWQLQEGGRRKTLDDFAVYLGVKRSTLSMWMNGARLPTGKFKKHLIDLFGDEVIEAFGEDPDQYIVHENWKYIPTERRRSIREEVELYRIKHETKRSPAKRRTRTSE